MFFVAPFLAGDLTASAQSNPPNILIILTDDQRYADTLEYMPKTMKWFREGGTEFTEAYTVAAICCPARSGVWTGQFIHNTGVYTTADAAAIDEDASIQRYLHDAGYKTGAFGKFFNSYPLTRTPKHFDDWAFHQSGYSNVAFNDHGVRKTVGFSPHFIKDRALEFIASTESTDSQPWYTILTPYAPHSPWIAEPKYADVTFPPWEGNPATMEVDRSDKPPHMQATVPVLGGAAGVPFDDTPELAGTLGQVNSNVPFDRQIYLRTLLTVDDMIDDIMTQLEAQGELDNTLAIFTTDQGLAWGEHGWYNKMVPYSEIVKIPFFLRHPAGGIAAGAVDNRLIASVDILPTLLDAAGIEKNPNKNHDGGSVLDPTWEHERILIEYNNQNLPATNPVPTWASIRAKDWQYAEYYNNRGEVTFREFYDLVNDPWQLENRFSATNVLDPISETKAAQLHEMLAADRVCKGVTGARACP